jgi:hypothetical protein
VCMDKCNHAAVLAERVDVIPCLILSLLSGGRWVRCPSLPLWVTSGGET